jgi:predicted branched-subunit amino acid permease
MSISTAASTPSDFLRGMRLFAPVAVSVAAYGLVWGVLAGQAGMSPLEVALISGLVFTGSGQFVALPLWTPGAIPTAAILLALAMVNLRMVLMSATIRPLTVNTPQWRALLAMFFVGDEQWALTVGQMDKGRGSLTFLVGAGTLGWLVWMVATMTGRLFGSFIADPAAIGLDFAFTATFLALLLGLWKGRSDILPWAVGAAAAIAVARLVPGQWYIIAGGLVGSAVGALVEAYKSR